MVQTVQLWLGHSSVFTKLAHGKRQDRGTCRPVLSKRAEYHICFVPDSRTEIFSNNEHFKLIGHTTKVSQQCLSKTCHKPSTGDIHAKLLECDKRFMHFD